ncbi:MAG: hypothetical protein MHMPM18_003968, partial [Marteilia pararefringens]
LECFDGSIRNIDLVDIRNMASKYKVLTCESTSPYCYVQFTFDGQTGYSFHAGCIDATQNDPESPCDVNNSSPLCPVTDSSMSINLPKSINKALKCSYCCTRDYCNIFDGYKMVNVQEKFSDVFSKGYRPDKKSEETISRMISFGMKNIDEKDIITRRIVEFAYAVAIFLV